MLLWHVKVFLFLSFLTCLPTYGYTPSTHIEQQLQVSMCVSWYIYLFSSLRMLAKITRSVSAQILRNQAAKFSTKFAGRSDPPGHQQNPLVRRLKRKMILCVKGMQSNQQSYFLIFIIIS